MRKLLLLFCCLGSVSIFVIALFLFVSNNRVSKGEPFDLTEQKKYFDLVNSRYAVLQIMPYDCDWDKLQFADGVLTSYGDLDAQIYEYVQEDVILGKTLEFSSTWSDESYILPNMWEGTGREAIDNFMSEVKVPDGYYYDELPEIQFREGELQAYTIVPLYQTVGDIEVYANEVTLWKDKLTNQYQIVLDEGQVSYSDVISFSNERGWQVELMNPDKVLDMIKRDFKNIFITTLSDDYYQFCRGDELKSILVNSLSIVYVRISDQYIYPFTKMRGEILYGEEAQDFSIIVDLTNSSDLKLAAYIDYVETGLYDYYVPEPEISAISYQDGFYVLEGYVPSIQYLHSLRSLNGFKKKLGYDSNDWSESVIEKILLRLYIQDEDETEINKYINKNLNYESYTGHFVTQFPSSLLKGQMTKVSPQICIVPVNFEFDYWNFINQVYIENIDGEISICSSVNMDNSQDYKFESQKK